MRNCCKRTGQVEDSNRERKFMNFTEWDLLGMSVFSWSGGFITGFLISVLLRNKTKNKNDNTNNDTAQRSHEK